MSCRLWLLCESRWWSGYTRIPSRTVLPSREHQWAALRNQVIYEARRAGNGFDTQDPINVYWIMVEKGGKTEDLNGIEKKSAYGVAVDSATKDKVVFNLKALKDRKIEVAYDPKDKKTKAIMQINGEPCELESVYINAKPGVLIPKVLNIDLTGYSVASGKTVKEEIKP